MRLIRDFTKLNLPFYLDWIDNNAHQHFVSKSFCYKTRKVKIAADVNLIWEFELFRAVKPLVAHSISNAKNHNFRNLVYLNTGVEVYLKIWDEKYEEEWEYERIIEGDIDNNQTVDSSNLQLVQADPYMSYFMKPFEIHAMIHDYYKYNIPDDESEDEEPPRVSMPFKTDKCVVCLNNEPKILFYNCLHYCVCSECKETNPFRKCPSCRMRIENKVMT